MVHLGISSGHLVDHNHGNSLEDRGWPQFPDGENPQCTGAVDLPFGAGSSQRPPASYIRDG